MPLHVAGRMSSLNRDRMAPGAEVEFIIDVPVKTLDDVLTQASAPSPIDLLSVDVEGHEMEVLQGFDFARWRPRLILVDDHVSSREKRWFLQSCGYRVIRCVGNNGWYVPATEKFKINWADRWQIWRKYYLGLPFRSARNISGDLRRPKKLRSL